MEITKTELQEAYRLLVRSVSEGDGLLELQKWFMDKLDESDDHVNN